MKRGSGPPGTVRAPRAAARRTPAAGPTDRELLGRFAAGRDQNAFAALVERHGPMVLGVCRRVLRDPEDAQDAFQVTFLVLARRAASLAGPELLAGWLHGVAYRTAVHLRARTARRRYQERQVADMPAPARPDPEEKREVLAVLDEELNHLPEMYRTLLVLCYLEGKTHEQAAEALCYPVGSMSWRVSRARGALHARLARRGVVLPLGLLALLLSEQTARAAPLPGEVVDSTARAATEYAGGSPASVPPDQVRLTEELLTGLPGRGRFGRAAVLLTAVILALILAQFVFAGLAWGHPPAAAARPGTQPAAANPTPAGGGPVPTGCSSSCETK